MSRTLEDNQKIFVEDKEGGEVGGRKGEMNNLHNSKNAYSMEIYLLSHVPHIKAALREVWRFYVLGVGKGEWREGALIAIPKEPHSPCTCN